MANNIDHFFTFSILICILSSVEYSPPAFTVHILIGLCVSFYYESSLCILDISTLIDMSVSIKTFWDIVRNIARTQLAVIPHVILSKIGP